MAVRCSTCLNSCVGGGDADRDLARGSQAEDVTGRATAGPGVESNAREPGSCSDRGSRGQTADANGGQDSRQGFWSDDESAPDETPEAADGLGGSHSNQPGGAQDQVNECEPDERPGVAKYVCPGARGLGGLGVAPAASVETDNAPVGVAAERAPTAASFFAQAKQYTTESRHRRVTCLSSFRGQQFRIGICVTLSQVLLEPCWNPCSSSVKIACWFCFVK